MPNLASVISVLIPVYNHVVVNLVHELNRQIMHINLEAEIVVLDDASNIETKQANREIADLSTVQYAELATNVGRAAIRNQLSTRAKFEYQLYLDADSRIVRDDFIRSYTAALRPNSVLVGGRLYQEIAPSQEYLLHWRYGRKRETRPLEYRQRRPAALFHSNNMVLPKSLGQSFSESLHGYGYEDLMLGQQLIHRGIEVKHIDNPVMHAQLETNQDFIQKHREAIANLSHLLHRGNSLDTRLGTYYQRLRRIPFATKILRTMTGLAPALINRLESGMAPLCYFDLYRLLLLHQTYDRLTD